MPTVDQEDNEVPSMDQKDNDTSFMDQKITNTPTMNQKANDTLSVDQKVNDTPTEDQKPKDIPSEDKKIMRTVVSTDKKSDTSEAEASPEEITKLLVLVRPFVIPKSDITSITNSGFGTTTIVKWYNTDCSLQEFDLDFSKPESNRRFGKYLSICITLSKLRHPNIQQLLGFVSQEEDNTEPSASIISESMDLTLTKLLTDHNCDEIQTTTHISICYDVAKAVYYLHSSKLSHMLIRSDCVLLTRSYCAKLCDIASSLLYQSGLNSEMEMVNANYLPPDDTSLGASCAKIDTFSVGVLFLQTITHVAPNPAPNDEKNLTEIERRQDHIDLVYSSHPLLTLIIACLSNKPDDRPTDKEMCSVFEAALNTQN